MIIETAMVNIIVDILLRCMAFAHTRTHTIDGDDRMEKMRSDGKKFFFNQKRKEKVMNC